jgi:hypothetical protein
MPRRSGQLELSLPRASTHGGARVGAFSVQTDHLHAIVEADDDRALRAGTRGLAIRVSLAVNRILARKGPVWSDRYHTHALRTPAETRTWLAAVGWRERGGGPLRVAEGPAVAPPRR